jgi:CBS-domain-containing membrane protein
MKVEQLMNHDVKACHPEDSLNHAAQLMWDHSCGALVVVDAHSRPLGFLTDRDICMAAYTRGRVLHDLKVEGAMASSLICCGIDDELTTAMDRMRVHHVRRLPVVGRDGTLAGILALDDLAYEAGRTLRGSTNQHLREQVAEVFIAISHGRVAARASHT